MTLITFLAHPSSEYDTATKKLTDVQSKQENDRQEISRLRKKYNDLQKAHAELERVHFNCSDNGNASFATGTTPQSLNKIDHHVILDIKYKAEIFTKKCYVIILQ